MVTGMAGSEARLGFPAPSPETWATGRTASTTSPDGGSSAGGSSYSPAVERALAIIGSIFAIMGFALGAVASDGVAGRMDMSLVSSLVCAGIGGVMGAGLGFVIPRIVLAALLLAWFVVLLMVMGVVIVALVYFGQGLFS